MTFLSIFGFSGLPEKHGVSGLFNKHFNAGTPFTRPPKPAFASDHAGAIRGNKYII